MGVKQVLGIGSLAIAAVAATGFIVVTLTSQASEPKPEPPEKPKEATPVSMIDPVSDRERQAASAHVQKISEGKATVTDVFRGPNGYLGVVVNANEKKFIGWMPPSLDSFFVGAMFDRSGRNITQIEMQARGFIKPESAQDQALPPQAAIRKAVESTTSYMEGSSGPIVTAFVDFNCSYCRAFYQRSRAFVNRGAMRIKWVPVAILQDDSVGKAAAVMVSPDPVAAIGLSEEDRLIPIVNVAKPLQEKIGANTAVLNLLSGGKPGTPTLVMSKGDGSFNISPGLPRDLAEFLAAAGS